MFTKDVCLATHAIAFMKTLLFVRKWILKAGYNWASMSEPHTSELKLDFSYNIIGASAASPTFVVKMEIYI